MMLNKLHKNSIDYMMLVNNMQVKMIVVDLFPNEDVVLMKNLDNNEDIMTKEMKIEYR
jgi:hypothetical protein